jgi:hypothetical protein
MFECRLEILTAPNDRRILNDHRVTNDPILASLPMNLRTHVLRRLNQAGDSRSSNIAGSEIATKDYEELRDKFQYENDDSNTIRDRKNVNHLQGSSHLKKADSANSNSAYSKDNKDKGRRKKIPEVRKAEHMIRGKLFVSTPIGKMTNGLQF